MDNNEVTSGAEVFVPKKCFVTIGDKTFDVKKFSLKDWIELAREGTTFASSVFARIRKEVPDVDIRKLSALDVMPFIWEDLYRIVPILSLAIDVEPEWLEEQNDMEGVSSLFTVITELNNFRLVFKNFTAGFTNLSNQWKEVTTEVSEEAS